tara:strand:- start:18108 stop:19355 length:1248 start_codon:yes stop_codon:yes gene_type:complete
MVVFRLNFLPILMLAILIFQVSVLPDTLNMKLLARVANALILVMLLIWVFLTVNRKQSALMWSFFTLPCFLVLAGFSINFLMALSPETLGQAGKFIPWLSLLVIPFVRKANVEIFWDYFYKFMFVSISISIIEYVAVFSGYLTPVVIETDRGVFYKGIFSIFHYLEGGIVYYRFYGIFAEPGTTAMFVLPALVYAVIFKKYIAALVFVVAMILTDSLGGVVSLLVTLFLFFLWKTAGRTKASFWSRCVVFILMPILFLMVADNLTEQYEHKQLSASLREDNVSNFIENIGEIIVANPFGFVLKGKSMSELADENEGFLGSNFTFYTAFVLGGVLSFVGYTIFFFLNIYLCTKFYLKGFSSDKILACAMISLPGLLLFCFQRTTILETALYSFLFAIPLVTLINYSPSKSIIKSVY